MEVKTASLAAISTPSTVPETTMFPVVSVPVLVVSNFLEPFSYSAIEPPSSPTIILALLAALFTTKEAALICKLLPVWLYDWIGDTLGVNKTMEGFVGRN